MRPSILAGLCLIAVLAVTTGGRAFAAMTSTNYEIRFDDFGTGGDNTSSSSSYQLRDSTGSASSQGGSSSSYQVNSGFRAGIFDQAVDFELFIQSRASQVAATTLSGSTVTVTSAAGFSAGDMVVVIQDEGATQTAAVGKISSIASNDLVLDSLTGGSPTIDGTNDYVYSLDGSSISFSTLSASTVATGIIAWEINNDTDQGYSVYVVEDQQLTNGLSTVPDVSDGSVTAGSAEYGGRSSDASLASSTFDSQDTAFSTSLQQVGSRSGVEFQSRDFLTVKWAISDTQNDGAYSHTLTLVYVGDY